MRNRILERPRAGGRRIRTTFLALAIVAIAAVPGRANDLVLVDKGRARSVIVIEASKGDAVKQAAEELRYHISRASGARLPIVSPREANALPPETIRIVVGPGILAKAAGVNARGFGPEEYQVKTLGNQLILAGRDRENPALSDGEADAWRRPASGTLSAVCHLLDRHLGVRWLWPGELGTHVPSAPTIAIPAMDVRARPELERRDFRFQLTRKVSGQIYDDAMQWIARQGLGERTKSKFGHSFTDWLKRYGKTHPEYFARPPDGTKPMTDPRRAKLCVSTPAVADQIIAEWTEAGCPDRWQVAPNDGSGFCTCEQCRALDGRPEQKPEDIWNANNVNLTGRYVTLWNTLLRRMKEKKPDVMLESYAYGAYREPPAGIKLESGMILGIVHGYSGFAYDNWRGWHDAGAKLFLRPNWWWTGDCAPHIPLHTQGDFVRFARTNSMIECEATGLMGYWSTQGPLYYTIARLLARPDLTVDDALGEYCSAFGPAAPAIRKYLAYWEEYTERCAYPAAAGGSVSAASEGLFERARRASNVPDSATIGSHLLLPELYPESIVNKAEAILGEAEMSIAPEDGVVRARIEFLRDGLAYLKKNRDAVALWRAAIKSKSQETAEARKCIDDLHQMLDRLAPRHVVWPEVVRDNEDRKGYFQWTGRLLKLDLWGM